MYLGYTTIAMLCDMGYVHICRQGWPSLNPAYIAGVFWGGDDPSRGSSTLYGDVAATSLVGYQHRQVVSLVQHWQLLPILENIKTLQLACQSFELTAVHFSMT